MGGNLGFGGRRRGLGGGAGLFQFLGQNFLIMPELADGLALLIMVIDAVKAVVNTPRKKQKRMITQRCRSGLWKVAK